LEKERDLCRKSGKQIFHTGRVLNPTPVVSNRTLILECGSSRVALGVFTHVGKRLCLHELVVEDFGAGDNPAGHDGWLKNVRVALRSIRARTKSRGRVVVLLPAHLTLTKLIKLPRVEAAQREKILRFEAAQNIPYALTDVVWDSVVVSETAAESEVLLATAKLEILDPLCAAAQEAGFDPRLVLPSSFATLAGFKLIQEDDAKSILGLNLGERSTSLVLVESARFALRTFALGIDQSKDEATVESLVGVEKIEPIRTRLLQEITRSLLHFQWRSKMGKPSQVCLSGTGAKVPGLVEAVSERLKIPVHIYDLHGVIDFESEPVKKSAADYPLTLIDLVGAAATQLSRDLPVVNLLPPRMLERAGYRQRRPWLVAAALLMTTILIPPLVHFRDLRDEAGKKSAAIERELVPTRARDLRNRANLQRVAELNLRTQAFNGALERRHSWLLLLAGLQDRFTQVEDVWLEKMQLAPQTPDAPLKLVISGRILDRSHPLAKVSPETFARFKTLTARLVESPFVTAVETERFDNQQPGILKFDLVLVSDAQRPL
jgi:type IV pilus assembly protein PilM